MPAFSHIVELRQYTLRPGKRDGLIDLFENEFIEPQEAVGMTIIGQFRDLDDSNRFVRMRGYPDMPSRAKSLAGFYDGALWMSRRDAANATLLDNDNVLLLRPTHPHEAFALEPHARPAPGAVGAGRRLVIATIYHIHPTDAKEAEFVDVFQRTGPPLLTQAGAPGTAAVVLAPTSDPF